MLPHRVGSVMMLLDDDDEDDDDDERRPSIHPVPAIAAQELFPYFQTFEPIN